MGIYDRKDPRDCVRDMDSWVRGETNDAPRTKQVGNNEQLYDGSVSWANSAAQGTENNIDIDLPTNLQKDAKYVVTVTNPSSVTGISVIVKNKETFDVARYPKLTEISVPVNTPDGLSVVVDGWLVGEGGRLTLINDTALGLTDGFTAYVRVRKI